MQLLKKSILSYGHFLLETVKTHWKLWWCRTLQRAVNASRLPNAHNAHHREECGLQNSADLSYLRTVAKTELPMYKKETLKHWSPTFLALAGGGGGRGWFCAEADLRTHPLLMQAGSQQTVACCLGAAQGLGIPALKGEKSKYIVGPIPLKYRLYGSSDL